jgi:hypothetical protein
MTSTNPEMVEYGFAISPGTENFMTIRADVLHSNENIDKISYEKRGCYVDGEKDLRFYRNYAYLNCFMECSSNHTFDVSYSFVLFATHFRFMFKRPYFHYVSTFLSIFDIII